MDLFASGFFRGQKVVCAACGNVFVFLCARDPDPERKLYLAAFKTGVALQAKHTFSAFWLRSSVVSVLISLISGTWRMASHEFK